jgi:hypothetical protein
MDLKFVRKPFGRNGVARYLVDRQITKHQIVDILILDIQM